MLKGLVVSARGQLRIEILHKLEHGKISLAEAILILGVSERTLRRYRKKYRENGVLSVQHGNKGRAPKNRISEDTKRRLQKLVREKYYDLNMQHYLEKLRDEHGIVVHRETFRKWCHEINCVKRARRRRVRPRFRRERMERAGVMVQMDGSVHRWFGNQLSCLIATIDDATNEIPYAEFFEAETSLSCLKVLKNVIRQKGVFSVLYVDRAGAYGGIKRSGFAQVQRALEEVGTQTIYAHSPEAKGRIERLFLTLQDRLIPELRLNGIKTLEQANVFLHRVFLPQHYNTKYLIAPHNPEPACRSPPPGTDLREVFSIRELRVVSRDHTLSLNSERYQVVGRLKHSIHKQKIEIRTYVDGSQQAFFAGRKIKLINMKDKMAVPKASDKFSW